MTLTIIASTALAAWVWLALFHGRFWRASERLDVTPEPANWPAVVAVIPARDEAETIAAAVASHAASDYPGAFSIVVADDGSTDGTPELASVAGNGRARTVDVIEAPPLTSGWTGKLNAVNAGVHAARRTAPDADYLLLTDADIVHAPETLRRLVAKAESDNLALASLMARLDARGFWGALLVPAFVYFFQKLYPFPLSNDPADKTAAAAGGCMLVNRAALEAAGGIEAVCDRLIDDCALAERLKHHGPGAPRRIWIGLADYEVRSLRDNRSLASIWNMVARTAFVQLGHSWALLAGTIAGLAFLYLSPVLIALTFPLHGDALAGVLALAAWIVMTATYLPTARIYGLRPAQAAALPAAATLYGAMTLSSAYRHSRGDGGRWKGRTYS